MMRSPAVFAAVLLLAAISSAAQNFQPSPDSGPATFGGGTYSYDPAGNVIAIDSQAFLYDTNGRLKEATVMAPDLSMVTQSYTYDVYGNVLTMTRPGVTQTLTADSMNHLTNTGAVYDAGNLNEWKPPGTSTTYKYGWDALGNLQSIRLASQAAADPPAVAYLYTASDERISSFDVPNLTSQWVIRDLGGQALTVFLDNQSTWSWTRDYFYRDGAVLASAMPTVLQHYTVDHLGSPRLITDDLKRQIAAQTFLPFGEELQATFANGASIKKFTSHERDSDVGLTGTNLDYMHARYYNGLTGRFMSIDPVLDAEKAVTEPQRWNRYTYVVNNPLRYTDADGRKVSITINRDTYTNDTVTGTITVTSDVKDAGSFSGYTLENTHAGDKGDKNPIPAGTYDASIRTDHTPHRVELNDVPDFSNVQIHTGNTKDDVKGCFAVGNSRSADKVSESKAAMNSILKVIESDNSGEIEVTVVGDSTQPKSDDTKKESKREPSKE